MNSVEYSKCRIIFWLVIGMAFLEKRQIVFYLWNCIKQTAIYTFWKVHERSYSLCLTTPLQQTGYSPSLLTRTRSARLGETSTNQIGKRLQLHILFSRTRSNDKGMLTFSKLGISRIIHIDNHVLSRITNLVNIKDIANVVKSFSRGKSTRESDFDSPYFAFPAHSLPKWHHRLIRSIRVSEGLFIRYTVETT